MLPAKVVQWLDKKIVETEKMRTETVLPGSKVALTARLNAMREVLGEFGKATAKEENICPVGAPAFVVLRRNENGERCFLGVGNSTAAAQVIIADDTKERGKCFDDDAYEVLPTTIEGDKRAS